MPRCQLQAFPGPNAELSIQASRSPESHLDALTIPVICVFKPPPSNALASCRRRPLKTWSPVAKPAALSCRGTAIPHRTGTARDRTRFVPARETKLGDGHDCRGKRLVPDRQKSTVDAARVALSTLALSPPTTSYRGPRHGMRETICTGDGSDCNEALCPHRSLMAARIDLDAIWTAMEQVACRMEITSSRTTPIVGLSSARWLRSKVAQRHRSQGDPVRNTTHTACDAGNDQVGSQVASCGRQETPMRKPCDINPKQRRAHAIAGSIMS